MPPDFNYQQKRKLRTDVKVYIWDDPLLFRRGAYQIIRRRVPEDEQGQLLINVMHHHMEDTLQKKEHPRKFSNQVFIGLLFSKTIWNGRNIVIDVREWPI